MTVSSAPVFLATTALEDFWDIERPLVFLHDGCCRYSRRSVWQPGRREILRSPIEDRETYYAAYKKVRALYEEMLPLLGERLNSVHGTAHEVRYWRMTVGCWFLHYLHVLYEHYVTLKSAIDKYPSFMTFTLDPEDYVTPRDTAQFVNQVVMDGYNLQIYSRLLKALGYEGPSRRYTQVEDKVVVRPKESLKVKALDIAGRFFGSRAHVWSRFANFSHAAEVGIFIRSMGKVWFDYNNDSCIPDDILVDKPRRAAMPGISSGNDPFGLLVDALLWQDLPRIFMEGFSWAQENISRNYPSLPRVITSATSWYFDDVFKFWSAASAAKGTKIIGIQHGTIYGLIRCWPPEEYETAFCDKFYSWGWRENHLSCDIVPLPATKFINAKKLGADNRRQGILLSTNCFPRYFYRFQDFRNYDNEAYFQWQRRFMDALPPALRYATRVRLFVADMGNDCRERWRDYDPEVKLEDWSMKFVDSLRLARLHVSDHLASTFVDGFIADKPTLLFWDPKVFQVRSSAEPYFDALRRADILFDSPEAAALAAVAIYPDVEAWWSDPVRQRSVRDLCDRFALSSPRAVKRWQEALMSDGYS